MKYSSTDKRDERLLLRTARAVHSLLKSKVVGTGIQLKRLVRSDRADTDGWNVTVADLGWHRPQLQIWLDFQTGYAERT
jgi:hypothetical protein